MVSGGGACRVFRFNGVETLARMATCLCAVQAFRDMQRHDSLRCAEPKYSGSSVFLVHVLIKSENGDISPRRSRGIRLQRLYEVKFHLFSFTLEHLPTAWKRTGSRRSSTPHYCIWCCTCVVLYMMPYMRSTYLLCISSADVLTSVAVQFIYHTVQFT